MRSLIYLIPLCLILAACQSKTPNFKINVSFNEALSDDDLDGRLLLMLSTNNNNEPRFQINSGLNTQHIYGLNVENMSPDTQIVFDGSIFGYPTESLDDLPAGDYYVQALLHVYETFNLSTGHTVKLPMDNGEGQQWNRSPGNLYSKSVKITLDAAGNTEINIVMDQKIPEIKVAEDTEWIKHVQLRSEKLSAFWGRDIYLGAHVLLPKGFDEHPEAKYPLMIFHGHFPSDFGGFRTSPPDPELKPDYSERFNVSGYNIMQQQEAYDFYKRWISEEFPRFIIIQIQHPTPYYDDSYAVNSANQGTLWRRHYS